MNNKGIELSVNFIVMLILAIVVFAFGLIFAGRLLGGSREVIKNLPEMEQAILENCINNGQPVCLVKNRKEISHGENDVFGLAILNNLGTSGEFKVFLDISTAIDTDNNPIDPASITVEDWTFTTYGPKTIANNEHEKIPVPFFVPRGTELGQYVFNVNVCYDDGDAGTSDPDQCENYDANFPDLYEATHKIYVTVG